MAEDAWDAAVSDMLARVAGACSPEETGARLAARACEMGEYMVKKVETSQGMEGTSDCEKGCGWCCHAQVPVSKPEAEWLRGWINENFSRAHRDDTLARIARNRDLTEGRSLEERVAVWDQTPCIFLHESVCRVYPVRPLVCRAWHALNREQCRRAFLARETGAEIDNTPFRNYILGVVRDELARIMPWPGGGVLPLPEAMACLI
ncbi:YkgJ family cysteine cluster protein [Desulfoluna spongiiphila]|uniref:Putative zinc-or iron-chelating domain-containing protein n=1 Tax=Desulfoluna spongiiphila TaxID=419481 RepID=A0A1G5DG41_9BACT|nr:YkgJ family cysteine cluster protein [Desulfoluna spongiiphila]SCY13428.1 Putative zinc-or iron-chelating domain-containing protein [Desulfoluna spongiiphila]VVS95164.1 putative zinc- or iron-chelating domain containing protein [Desulfoluna spongiiphila]